MDLLTQIQIGVARLPGELQESLAALVDAPLSVQEAHALAQLAQTGFIGFQSITNPVVPVGLNDELVPFLGRATDAIALAQDFYTKIRTIDVYISKIPETRTTVGSIGDNGDGNGIDCDFETELRKAIEQHDESVQELFEAECRSKAIRANIKTVIDFGVNLSTKQLGVVEDVSQPPSMDELFTPIEKHDD